MLTNLKQLLIISYNGIHFICQMHISITMKIKFNHNIYVKFYKSLYLVIRYIV